MGILYPVRTKFYRVFGDSAKFLRIPASMTTLNEGRNEIRFNNSGGKCLLENWVEERTTQHLEDTNTNLDKINSAKMLKNGHKGLLTLDNNAKAAKVTTNGEIYKKPSFPKVEAFGKKYKDDYNLAILEAENQMNKIISEKFSNQPMEIKSVKQSDFDQENFKFCPPDPTVNHSLYNEQQISFWTDNSRSIHGVSQQKVMNDPFRKNTAFSKPHQEYNGEDLPHGINNNF